MKGNVNPFVPWRPVESQIPQPIHASRPWRPPPPPPARPAVVEPPVVKPVGPPLRDQPRVQPSRPERPSSPISQPSSGRTPFSRWIVFILLVLLGVLCLDSVGWYRGTHIPRLAALGASAGLFAVVAFNQRRSWYTRLRGMAASLALAGIAAWFVPTLHGVSLWLAYRQVEELRALPAGDVAEYQRGAAARQLLVKEFPSFASEIEAAKQAWLRRTVDEAIENTDRQLENDPQTAFANLHRLNTELARLEHYASVRNELEAARSRAMQASAKVVQREVKNEQVGQHGALPP